MKAQYDTIIGSNGQKFSFLKGLIQAMPIYNEIYNNFLNQPQCNIIWDTAPHKIIQGVRQSGKTRIIEGMALLHAILFPYKTILITSHSKRMSNSINEDIRQLYYSLPKESKPGLKLCSHERIVLDNGSQILTSIATENSGRGYGIDLLLMDEAAFYNENSIKDFWYSLANGRMVKEIFIASTRKNRSKKNFFWRMWLGAGEGTNGFKQFKISNNDCPTVRDAKWVKEMKKMLGRATYDREHTIRSK